MVKDEVRREPIDMTGAEIATSTCHWALIWRALPTRGPGDMQNVVQPCRGIMGADRAARTGATSTPHQGGLSAQHADRWPMWGMCPSRFSYRYPTRARYAVAYSLAKTFLFYFSIVYIHL
jgi:hypothetical protein